MSWNDLSMADRAAYIKLGVENGITDLNTIRNAYNEFAKGGPIKNSKDYKKALSDYWHEDVNSHDYDYDKYYNDDPVEAQKQLNLILSGKGGHFPDAGKSGTYKKPTHPTYPDLGDKSWSNNDTVFHLSDRQMNEDTDRVLDYLGADLDYNNGSTKAVYKGGFILPTITVTPKGNYTDLVPNELNSGWVYKRGAYNKYDDGGPLEQQLRKLYPHYTDAQIQALIRSRQAMKNINEGKKETTKSSNRDYSKDIELVMGALHDQANSLRDIDIKEASIKQEQEAKDKWAHYKLGIEAGTTAAELLAGTYFLTKGALKGTNAVAKRLSRTTNRYGVPVYNTSSTAGKVRATTDKLLNQMDKGQTAMSSIGFGADIAQLMQGDTSWANNAELVGDAAGIIGGTNIIRNTPWFGRYRKGIDTTLDLIGYGAAGYDVGHYLFGK